MLIKAARMIKHKGRWHRSGEVFEADSQWAEYLIRLNAAEAATEAPGDERARENETADPGPLDAEPTEANQVGPDRDDEPTKANQVGPDRDADPTEANQVGPDRDDEPTEANQVGPDPDDEPTGANQVGPDRDADPTEANQVGPDTDAEPTGANQVGLDLEAADLPDIDDMTKKEIIRELTAAGVEVNPKSLKDDLFQMLLEVWKESA